MFTVSASLAHANENRTDTHKNPKQIYILHFITRNNNIYDISRRILPYISDHKFSLLATE